ncbi:MAG: bifunctional folylpolyglutamate synthase/dihydrofolate synthase, partial [Planctomycetales bacterium]
LGAHQAANAAVAVAVIEVLRGLGWQFSDDRIREGLAKVECRARVEIVASRPLIIIDAAHNVASIDALASVLDGLPAIRRSLVFASSLDKDCRGMLAILLPRFHHVVFTRYLNNPRSTPPLQLEQMASDLESELPGCKLAEREICDDPVLAWNTVRQKISDEDLICVTGSFFIAAELRRLIEGAIPQTAEA